MSLTFLVGGARSGKSSLAVSLARRWSGHVSLIVTAEARDSEMTERIERHRSERPWDWTVIEEPTDMLGALRSVDDASLLIVDCLTLWVSNLMESDLSDAEIIETAQKVAAEAAGRGAPVIVISNEVGSGIVPMAALTRRYRDLLGAVNAAWSTAATDAYLVVAGRTLRLDDASGIQLDTSDDR